MNDFAASAHSPSALIMARCRAFGRRDFGFIYDSYHSDSNFRRQFDDRDEYCHYGEASLGRDFRIIQCQIIDQHIDHDRAEVVFLMDMEFQGALQKFAELAWLKREDRIWRYLRGQKMTADELPDQPEKLKIEDFSSLDPNTVY